jgi:hypothetical protein
MGSEMCIRDSRMPEDLPVIKRINVKVGIIRNKIIY